MTDTPEAIRNMMIEHMMRLSGEERLRMGFSMFDTARRLALASMKDEDPASVRVALFLRFYGNDFKPAMRQRIAKHLAQGDK